jgi:hypothetical protein
MRSTRGFPSPGGSAGELVETANNSVVRTSIAQTSYHRLIAGFPLRHPVTQEPEISATDLNSSTALAGFEDRASCVSDSGLQPRD